MRSRRATFTFRSREFEQMEIEFFCHPTRPNNGISTGETVGLQWYTDLGLSAEQLRLA